MRKILIILLLFVLCACSTKNVSFVNPVKDGQLVSSFDESKGVKSIAIRPNDLLNETKVLASEDGKVISIDKRADNTMVIEIKHCGGYETVYSGVKDLTIELNDVVKKGEILGYLNDRLDFVIIKDGQRLNDSFEYLS